MRQCHYDAVPAGVFHRAGTDLFNTCRVWPTHPRRPSRPFFPANVLLVFVLLALAAGADHPAAGQSPPTRKRVFVLEINERIDHHMLAAFRKAATYIRRYTRDEENALVVVCLNTPGGLVDVETSLVEIIERLPANDRVAFVYGDGALSAGMGLAIACDKIYMTEKSLIGAAAIVGGGVDQSPRLADKITSADAAAMRARAAKHGHAPLIVNAMCDPNIELWAVPKADGSTEFVSGGASGPPTSDAPDRKPVLLSPRGRLLTFNGSEAVQAGFALPAKNLTEVIDATGFAHAKVTTFHVGTVAQKSRLAEIRRNKRRAEALGRALADAERFYRKALDADPHNFRYKLDYRTRRGGPTTRTRPSSGWLFVDGGAAWRQNTDKSLAYLRKCWHALKYVEAVLKAQDAGAEAWAALEEFKASVRDMRKRLEAERDALTPYIPAP